MRKYLVVRPNKMYPQRSLLLVPKKDEELHRLIRNIYAISKTVSPLNPTENTGVYVKDFFSRIFTIKPGKEVSGLFDRNDYSPRVLDVDEDEERYKKIIDCFSERKMSCAHLNIASDSVSNWRIYWTYNYKSSGTRHLSIVETGMFPVEMFLPEKEI